MLTDILNRLKINYIIKLPCGQKKSGSPPSFTIAGIAAIFCIALVFTSCKKSAQYHNKTTDTIGFIDTGTTTKGATLVSSMLADTIVPTSFTPAPAILIRNENDLVITGEAVSGISLYNCNNVTIKNCLIGPGTTYGILLTSCTNITISNCYIYNVSTAVFATGGNTISVINCQAKNMLGPFPAGQFVQFKNVSGGGSKISFNKFENILGASYPEDAISLYACNGLPTDPIVIESNWIRGGGPSKSGGGIMLGDGSGSNEVAKNNILADPGQYGIAVSGGTYLSIVNNTIYAKSQSFTDVGIYDWNQTKLPSSHISIGKNAINYTDSKGELYNLYLAAGEQTPIGWSTNVYEGTLNESLLPSNIVSASYFDRAYIFPVKAKSIKLKKSSIPEILLLI